MRPHTYEITFSGQAGRTLRAQFDDCKVTTGPDTTTLRAELPDQAALSGLVQRIAGLGLVVIDVHLVTPAIWAMTDHRVYRLTAATPDRSGYQKARADAAARAARGQTYLDQRPMGGPGVFAAVCAGHRCWAFSPGTWPQPARRRTAALRRVRGRLAAG